MAEGMKLLRIYTDEAAYFGDRKVFEEVVIRARDAKMAGATVFQTIQLETARRRLPAGVGQGGVMARPTSGVTR